MSRPIRQLRGDEYQLMVLIFTSTPVGEVILWQEDAFEHSLLPGQFRSLGQLLSLAAVSTFVPDHRFGSQSPSPAKGATL